MTELNNLLKSPYFKNSPLMNGGDGSSQAFADLEPFLRDFAAKSATEAGTTGNSRSAPGAAGLSGTGLLDAPISGFDLLSPSITGGGAAGQSGDLGNLGFGSLHSGLTPTDSSSVQMLFDVIQQAT